MISSHGFLSVESSEVKNIRRNKNVISVECASCVSWMWNSETNKQTREYLPMIQRVEDVRILPIDSKKATDENIENEKKRRNASTVILLTNKLSVF